MYLKSPSDSYQAQLQQLTSIILQTRKSLGILSDKIINIRALQMDEAFECTEEMDKTISMMENYISQYQRLLQCMIENLLTTKDIMCISRITSQNNIKPVLSITEKSSFNLYPF